MATESVVDSKRKLMDVVTFNIPGHDCCRMTVSEIISKLNKDRIENIEEAVHTLIAVWTAVATVPENLTNAVNIFHSLFHETSLTILSGRWIRVTSSQKRQMAKVLTKSSQVFGPLVDKAARLCTVLVMAVYDPWGEPALNQLIEGQIEYTDATVGEFVNSEPEELLLTRVESLIEAGHIDAAIKLCKSCLIYCSANTRDGKDFHCKSSIDIIYNSKTSAFVEKILILLHEQGRNSEVLEMAGKLSCHDGIHLITEIIIKYPPNKISLPEVLTNLFLTQDIISHSTYCCTKDLMALWCKLQSIQKRSLQEISNAAQRLICHASTSAYFYLFADKLWDQFGASLLPLYLEMYIRGLTSDLNYFEIIRGSVNMAVLEIESHLDFVFTKLASLFMGKYDEISFECLLTAFSFNPTIEKLDKLKYLNELLSLKNSQCTKLCKRAIENTDNNNITDNYYDCICDKKYSLTTESHTLSCDSEERRPIYSYHFPHLVLDSDLGKVPYSLLKDFVTLLECMRNWQLKSKTCWETTRKNCLTYLDKFISVRKSFQQTSSYDSADSEMDSPSEGDDDVSNKILKAEETVPEHIYKESFPNEFSKITKSKTQQRQKYHTEDNEIFEISTFATVDNDLDKEMKKRKKKRKTKREKDRESSIKKQNTEDTQTIIVHKVKSNDAENSKSSMNSLSHIATLDLANMTNHKVKIFFSETNSSVSVAPKSCEDNMSPIMSNTPQNRNPVVVLSDILSDKLALKSGRVNNKLNFQYVKGKETLNLSKPELEKNTIDSNYDELALSSSFLSNPDNILNSLQKVVGKKPLLGNENDNLCNENNISVKFSPSSVKSPSSSILKSNQLYKTLDGRESNFSTGTEHLSVSQSNNENISSFQSCERTSNINTEQNLNINDSTKCESENVENKTDMENNLSEKQKCENNEESNNAKVQMPVSTLPNKIKLQVDKASGIVPMPVATLTIPLPVGVQNSTGSKVLSGKLVIPVNTLQKAISASTPSITSTPTTADTINNANKSRMLSIPNLIVMKNVQNEINEDDKMLKDSGSNTSSKQQKRIWASVRNLHGSIEWRKVADRGNNLIKMSQKPQSSKSKSGTVLTPPNFPNNESIINELVASSSNIINSSTSLFCNSENSLTAYENTKNSDYLLAAPNPIETSSSKIQITSSPPNNFQESVDSDVLPINLSLPKNPLPEDLSNRKVITGSHNEKQPYQTIVQENLNNLNKIDKPDSSNVFSSVSSLENSSSSSTLSKSSPLISHLLSNTPHSKRSTIGGPFSSMISSFSKMSSHAYIQDQNHLLNETFKRDSLETLSDTKLIPKDYSFHYPSDYQTKKNYLEGMQSSKTAQPSEAAKLSLLVANNTNRLKNENIQHALSVDHSYQYNTSTGPFTSSNNEQSLSRQMFHVNNNHSSFSADNEDDKIYKNSVSLFPTKNNNTNCNKRKISCKKSRNPSNTKLKLDNETTEREVQMIMGQIYNEMKNKGNFSSNENNRNFKSTLKSPSLYQRSKLIKRNINERKPSLETSKDLNDESEVDKVDQPLEKKYGCVLCASRLSHQYSLKRHYKAVHHIEVLAKDSFEKILQAYEAAKSQNLANPTTNILEKTLLRNEAKETSNVSSQSRTFKTIDPVQSSEIQNNALPAIDVAFPNFNVFHQPNTQCSVSSVMINHPSVVEKKQNPVCVSDVSVSSCSQSNILSSVEWNQGTCPQNIQEINLKIHSKDNFDTKSSVVNINNQLNSLKNESFDVSKTVPCVSRSSYSNVPSLSDSDFRHKSEKQDNDKQLIKNITCADTNHANNVDKNTLESVNLTVNEPEPISLKKINFENKNILEIRETIKDSLLKEKFTPEELTKNYEDFSEESCVISNKINSNELNSNKNTSETHNAEECNNYKPRSNGDKNKVNDSDNTVDCEVSKLVAHLLHIDNKPLIQDVNLSDVHKDIAKQENHLCKEVDDGKSESAKLLRQRTRPRQSPNSHMKRSCPCCRDSETSSTPKKCRNISNNISKTIRHPTSHWMNVAKNNVNLQSRKSKKPSSVITTRSSKRLRTRSSTVLLT